MRNVHDGACLIALCTALAWVATPAHAQEDAPEQQPPVGPKVDSLTNDIIVTARKRAETSLSVPVVMTAVSGERLTQLGINSIDALGKLAPNLLSGEGGGSQQGIVAIRGISGSESNPTADQAVSFNIDGVQVSRSVVRRLAMMDLAQVEVLKGPQALFFGKNSPAGVISINGAEPTQSFQSRMSAGFEPYGSEVTAEGFVSGPITPELGARVAVYGSRLKGFADNLIDPSNIYAPSNRDVGKAKEFAARGTVKYEPSSTITAVLRVNYSSLRTNGPLDNSQLVDCPTGRPQLGDPIACKADDKTYFAAPGPFANRVNSRFGDGDPFLRQKQRLYSLNLSWDLSDQLKLSSITGIYDLTSRMNDNTAATANPAGVRPATIELDFLEHSQEIRLQSSFDSFLNFVIGTHLSDSDIHSLTQTYTGAVALAPGSSWDLIQKGKAYSGFGQLILTPFEGLEVSGGGRYSYERKRLSQVRSGFPPVDQSLAVTRATWKNFSPEATIAYRPSQSLTIFGSYKEGFLSGGFDAPGVRIANSDVRYGQQTVSGFEGGVKALLFDRRLRVDLTAYSYDLKGLQISTNVGAILSTQNAGRVSTDGLEFTADYRTPIDGLSLNGALAYADGVFDEYIVACYRGQTQAQGCNFGNRGANGNFSLQDRSGQRLSRSPKWSINGGFSYNLDLAHGQQIAITSNISYLSSFDTDPTGNPGGLQRGYALLDATMSFRDSSRRWEFAALGKNLTNQYTFLRSSGVVGTGTAPGGLAGMRVSENPGQLFH
ncbi:TonB-dependent receptor [Sphingobium sp. CR2-8]|uniref:TonB-dependent receptor n=1 Tax=Sphingobium sp. CR2-8 TaxID=1306534 RepID=UPI002DB9A301|nr:TonB-dependent receptor [Sphingobium sp. CR2-8]MEC3909507.1 TonB-dependent receptor [Sphingobium sp. CR2-8]